MRRAGNVMRDVGAMLLADRIAQLERDQLRDRIAQLERDQLRDRIGAVETSARLESEMIRADVARLQDEHTRLAVALAITAGEMPAPAIEAPKPADWWDRD